MKRIVLLLLAAGGALLWWKSRSGASGNEGWSKSAEQTPDLASEPPVMLIDEALTPEQAAAAPA
jgi:hypothetical protein